MPMLVNDAGECIGHITIIPTADERREPHGEPRWCFRCRKVQPFDYVMTIPVCEHIDDSGCWYGPTFSVECAVCHLTDGDLFPGRYRVWEEDWEE